MRSRHVSALLLLAATCLPGCPADDPKAGAGGGGGALTGKIFYESGLTAELHKLDLATGEDVKLGEGKAPNVAPDGKIVFTNVDMFEASEDIVTRRTVLATNPDQELSNNGFHNPRVSPDGTMIAYSTNDDNCYVVSRADAAVKARFDNYKVTEGCTRPTWTPDGRLVAAGGGFGGNPGLYISDAGLKTLTRFDPDLVDPSEPAVSPDGTKVAFILNKLVYVINLDGTGLLKVDTDDASEDVLPAWSPNGAFINYRSRGGYLNIRPAGGGAVVEVLATYPELANKITFFNTSYQLDWVE